MSRTKQLHQSILDNSCGKQSYMRSIGRVHAMTFTKFAISIGLAAQIVLATTAFADCVLPKPPSPVPNGESASAADMETARLTLERYQKAAKDYLACTDQDVKARIAKMGDNVDMIRQVKLMADKRNRGIEEDIQARADEFNDQLRLYKLTNRE